MRQLFLFLLVTGTLIPGFYPAGAQTPFMLNGLVTDESDNWLNDVVVTLEPLGINVLTDANGRFSLEIDPGKATRSSYSLWAAKVGYVSQKTLVDSMDLILGKDQILLKIPSNPVDENLIGFTVEMESSGNFAGTLAQFHVYIPESVDTVKAAFYLSRHGMGNITHEVLQRFAEEEKVALVAMFGDPVQRGINPVDKVDKYIDSLGLLSGHPELSKVPVMTFGHSNGTGFSASWPRDRPERCIAWIAYHPGFSNYLQYPNSEKVPAMVMCGSVDKYLERSRQDTVVAYMRESRNAAMNAMIEGNVGHGPRDVDATWEFVVVFLKSAMRIRLEEDGSCRDVQLDSGWLGSIYDYEKGGRQHLDIASYSEFTGNRARASWLPDEAFAKTWQCYGNKQDE